MPIIDVPEHGSVEFPDDTPNEIMESAIKERFYSGVQFQPMQTPMPATPAPLDLTGTAKQVLGGVGRGALESTASALEGVQEVTKRVSQHVLGDLAKEKTPLGKEPFSMESPAMQAAEGMRTGAKAIPVSKDVEDSFWLGDVPRGFGSTLPFLAASLLGPVVGAGVMAGPATLGALTGVGETTKEFREAGKEAGNLPVALGGLAGSTEGLPFGALFKTLDKVGGGKLKRALIAGGVEAFSESLQEMLQTGAGNAIAKEWYDENRGLMDNVLRSGAAAFVVGGGMGMGVSPFVKPKVSKSASDLGFTPDDFGAQEDPKNPTINDVAMQRFRDTYGPDQLTRANQEVINRTWEQENAPGLPPSPPSEPTPAPVPTGGPEYKAVAQSPAPLEPNIVESPGQGPVGRVLSPSLTDHPVQLALREVYADHGQAEMEAERYGAMSKVRFHVIDTPEGYKLRLGPEPKGELGLDYDQWLDTLPEDVAHDPVTFKALKDQALENIRAEANTGRGSLIETAPGKFEEQGKVDTNLANSLRAELEARKANLKGTTKKQLGIVTAQNRLDNLQDTVESDRITLESLDKLGDTKESIQRNLTRAGLSVVGSPESQTFPKVGELGDISFGPYLAELRARMEVKQNLDENFTKPKPLGTDLKAKARDVTESLLSPSGGKGVAPEAKATGPEDLTGPIGKGAAMLYKKRLGDDKSLEVVPAGDGKFKVVKLYTFSPEMFKGTLDWLLPGEGLGKRVSDKYRQTIGLPDWTARINEKFKPFYNTASKRHETFTAKTAQALDKISVWLKMDETERSAARTILNEIEGQKLKATPSPEIESYEENGKRLIRPVSAHIEEYKRFLDRKPKLTKNTKDFLVNWKQSMNEAFAYHYNSLVKRGDVDPELLRDLLNNVGYISNYMPHMWYGNNYVDGTNAKGELVARVMLPPFAKRLGSSKETFLKGLQSDPTFKDLTWSEPKRIQEIERFWVNTPVPIDVMNRLIDESAKRLEADPELAGLAKAYRKIIPQEVAQILKTRGFSSYAKRKGILGFEKQDITKVYYDYMNGVYSGLAKMDAASEYTKLLFETKPGAEDHKLFTDFIEDEFAPSSSFDRAMDYTRGLFFAKYLGARLKPAIVNLSNMMVSSIPNLGIYVKGEANSTKLHTVGANDIRKQFMKEYGAYRKATGIRGALDPKDNVLTVDEIRMQKDLLSDGAIQAQMMAEYRGQFRDNLKWQYQVMHKLGLPMEMTEWFMRAATALASFRAFRDGKITHEPTLQKYGLTAGEKVDVTDEARYQQAIEFSKEMVSMAHGDYTQFNKPPIIRGAGAVKAIGRSMYTFRFFSQHLAEMWNWQLRHEETGRGKTAFLKSMMGQAMIGGMTTVPMYYLLKMLYKALEKEDPELALREKFPEHSTVMDLAFEGAPSLAGIYLGGSLEVGFPTSVKEAIGIPFAVAEDITNAYNAWSSDNPQRAVEYMLPLVATKDLLAAYRGATQGQRTVGGRPIALPGEVEPTKFSPLETAFRVFGFRPASVEKGWRLSLQMQELEDYKSVAQSKYADRYNLAAVDGNTEKQIGVLDEVIAWNMYWLGKDRVDMVILKDSLNSALKSRALPKQPSKQVLGRSLKAKEAYGLQ